jgi:hypothetical protein
MDEVDASKCSDTLKAFALPLLLILSGVLFVVALPYLPTGDKQSVKKELRKELTIKQKNIIISSTEWDEAECVVNRNFLICHFSEEKIVKEK